MYAIIESGGKQYSVEEGPSLLVDRIDENEGAKVALRAVMFRSDDVIAAPKELEKVKVEAKVAEHERGPEDQSLQIQGEEGLPPPRPPLGADQARGDQPQTRQSGAGEKSRGETRREKAGKKKPRRKKPRRKKPQKEEA